MDFRDLTYISAIAEHQSITKAANALYVSQPTLSKFLLQTEQRLNVQLFNRIGKKYILTYAGERYLSYASKILSLKNNLDQEMSDIVSAKDETLRIGFSSVRGSSFIVHVIPQFAVMHPNVHLQLQEISYLTFENAILSGDLDIVFINLPIKNPGIEYQILSYDEILLITSQNHPIVHRAEVRKECNYPWIDLRWLKEDQFIMVSKELRMHSIIDALFTQARFTPKIHFYTRNLEAAAMLASEGFGVSFTNVKYISYTRFEHQPALFSLGSPATFRTFVAAYRKDLYLPRYVKDLINLAKNVQPVAPLPAIDVIDRRMPSE